MQVDHIFIVSTQAGAEADELVRFGLTEGSSRRHPGQGTQNRKFYFENFFLEILFVVDAEELSRSAIQASGLTARMHFQHTGRSPFGLCLVNTPDTDPLFQSAYPYQPDYFPDGMRIDVLSHDAHPSLPWMFRLPFRGISKKPDEPTAHPIGIRHCTGAELEVYRHDLDSNLQAHLSRSGIRILPAEMPHLTLVFDAERQGKAYRFATLPLTFRY